MVIIPPKTWLSAAGITILLFASLVCPAWASQDAPPPVVHAVMFWLEGCGHCQYVMEEVLPPLQTQYGEQFEIMLVKLVTTEDIDRLYQTAAAFGIAKDDVGVPFLVIDDRELSGSRQISEELPGLVEQYLAQGGVDYSDLPTLAGILPTGENTSLSTSAVEGICGSGTPCPQDLPTALVPESQPPEVTPVSNGFALAALVMFGMAAALLYSGVVFLRGAAALPRIFSMRWTEPAFLLLCLTGLGVAGYLSYVETQVVEALCGPVGDCNAVQSSSYARLFGILPMGILGMIGYLAILAAWLYPRLSRHRGIRFAPLVVLGMAVCGVLFSIYLTYLEIFVIRAVCIWCLTSAVIMTLLLLLSFNPALGYLIRDPHAKEKSS